MAKKPFNYDSEIALLQERVFNIKNNELQHLAEDIKRVDKKVDDIASENQKSHEKFETKIDDLKTQISKFTGGAAVIVILADWLLRLLTGK